MLHRSLFVVNICRRLWDWWHSAGTLKKRRILSHQNKRIIRIECLLCGRHLVKFAGSVLAENPDEGIIIPIAMLGELKGRVILLVVPGWTDSGYGMKPGVRPGHCDPIAYSCTHSNTSCLFWTPCGRCSMNLAATPIWRWEKWVSLKLLKLQFHD